MDPFRTVKGSPFGGSSLHPRGKYSMHPMSVETSVGFRLVRDGADGDSRGGSWRDPGGLASEAFSRSGLFREHVGASLGIRLCVDWGQS